MRVANLNLTKGGGVKLVVHNVVRRWNVQAEAYKSAGHQLTSSLVRGRSGSDCETLARGRAKFSTSELNSLPPS